jgi:hypothetical protein
MKAPAPHPYPLDAQLDIYDFVQEIAAPLEDRTYRDELTLSKLDFEELESGLDL